MSAPTLVDVPAWSYGVWRRCWALVAVADDAGFPEPVAVARIADTFAPDGVMISEFPWERDGALGGRVPANDALVEAASGLPLSGLWVLHWSERTLCDGADTEFADWQARPCGEEEGLRWLRDPQGFRPNHSDAAVCRRADEPVDEPTEEETDPDPDIGAWSEAHPVGTPVTFWPGAKQGEGRPATVSSAAWMLGGHTAVVKLEGYAGCVALTHIERREA